MRFLALLPLLALAACGGGEGNSATPVTSASAVKAVAPPAGKSWVDTVVKTPEGGYRQGNPDAPIKLVEYGSRSCPACKRFAVEGMEPLRENYIATGRVSYEFREFFVHPQDLGIALLGRCVSTEAFFPILDAMFLNQDEFNQRQMTLSEGIIAQLQAMPPNQAAGTWAEVLGYIDFMKRNGLPEAQARQCLANQGAVEEIAKGLEAAREKGVSATPTFYLNDRKLDGGFWPDIEPALRAAGAR